MVIVGEALGLEELEFVLGLGLGLGSALVWGVELLRDVVPLGVAEVFGRAWVPQPAKMRLATTRNGMARKA